MAHECNVKVSLCALAVYFVYSVPLPLLPITPCQATPCSLLPAAACPRGPMPAWILSIFINLIHGKQQQQAQLVWQLDGYARLENALLSFRLKNFGVISIYFVFFWLRQKLKICDLHQIKKLKFYCILFGAVNAFFESHLHTYFAAYAVTFN